MSSLFNLLDIANNGLETQRDAMEIAAENVANALTPGYKSKTPVIAARSKDMSFSHMLATMAQDHEGFAQVLKGDHVGAGSQVALIEEDQTPGPKIYIPGHPLADADGNVEMSNVDTAAEMIKTMEAVRQYKVNLSIAEMAKKASQEALNMTKNS
jgi:flagellar basal-body rod protein FlgC